MGLAQDLKREAEKAGFAVAGISNPDALRGLPYGKIDYVGVLKTPEEELPKVRSVILMGIYAWDTVFNIIADSSDLHFNSKQGPKVPLESYQLYYQIVRGKAWIIAHYLEKRGFDSILSVDIPLTHLTDMRKDFEAVSEIAYHYFENSVLCNKFSIVLKNA